MIEHLINVVLAIDKTKISCETRFSAIFLSLSLSLHLEESWNDKVILKFRIFCNACFVIFESTKIFGVKNQRELNSGKERCSLSLLKRHTDCIYTPSYRNSTKNVPKTLGDYHLLFAKLSCILSTVTQTDATWILRKCYV